MFFTKLILLLLSITYIAALNPGGTGSLDFAVIKEVKDAYFGYVLNTINKVQIPNISFHNGYLHTNTFHVTETSKKFQFDAGTKNSIKVSANDLDAKFHSSSLRYKKWFLVAHGSLDATISDMDVSLELGLTT